MKKILFKRIALLALSILTITITATSCSKNNSVPNGPDPGPHTVDARLVGTWIWTDAGDANWYDPNGVYTGPSYGLALEYKINADGTGSSLSHFTSTLGVGSSMEVNIASTGFYESDNDAHFGYFPLSGTYKSGTQNRNLNADELYNPSTGKGKSYIYQKLEFKTINGRQCFEVTSSEGLTDRYWKVE